MAARASQPATPPRTREKVKLHTRAVGTAKFSAVERSWSKKARSWPWLEPFQVQRSLITIQFSTPNTARTSKRGGASKPTSRSSSPLTHNPQPSTLNSEPSILNPQPSTLNPRTLNHQPSTPQPQPSTINHQPSTLNPQGRTSKRGGASKRTSRSSARVGAPPSRDASSETPGTDLDQYVYEPIDRFV